MYSMYIYVYPEVQLDEHRVYVHVCIHVYVYIIYSIFMHIYASVYTYMHMYIRKITSAGGEWQYLGV